MLCALQESRTHPDARVKHFELSLGALGTFCRDCVAWLLWEIQLADLAGTNLLILSMCNWPLPAHA
jgi:hypothetical protein